MRDYYNPKSYHVGDHYSSSPITRWLVIYGGGIGLSVLIFLWGIRSIFERSFTFQGFKNATMTLTGIDAMIAGCSLILLACMLHLWAFWERWTEQQKWAEPLRYLFSFFFSCFVIYVFYRQFIEMFTKGV